MNILKKKWINECKECKEWDCNGIIDAGKPASAGIQRHASLNWCHAGLEANVIRRE